uniref:INCENP_ARK-bind domain-containing protein n=1 Tax=Heterorhabditis bacteriophora TaxID=37862 RepID=A0A1I7XN02_HETBA
MSSTLVASSSKGTRLLLKRKRLNMFDYCDLHPSSEEDKEKGDMPLPDNIGSRLPLSERVISSTPAVDPNFIKQLNEVVVRFLHQITSMVKESPEEAIKITEKNVAKMLNGSLNDSSTENPRTHNSVQSRDPTENNIPSQNTAILEAKIARNMEKKLPYLSQIAIQATSHQPKVVADYKIRHAVENELSEVVSSTLLNTENTPTSELNRTNNLAQTTTNYSTITISRTSFNNQRRLNAEKNRSAHAPQFPVEENTTQSQFTSTITTTEINRQINRLNEPQRVTTRPIPDSTTHITTKVPHNQLEEVVHEMNRITNFRQTTIETTAPRNQISGKNLQHTELKKWSEPEVIHSKMATANINKPLQRNVLDNTANLVMKKNEHEQSKSRLLPRINEAKNGVFANNVKKPVDKSHSTKLSTTTVHSTSKQFSLSELKIDSNSPINKQRSSTVKLNTQTQMQQGSIFLNRKSQSTPQNNRVVSTNGNQMLESTTQVNHGNQTMVRIQHKQVPNRSVIPKKTATTSPQVLSHMRMVDKTTLIRQQKLGIQTQRRNGSESALNDMKNQNKAGKPSKQFLQKPKPNLLKMAKKQQNDSKNNMAFKDKKSDDKLPLHFKFQRESKEQTIEPIKTELNKAATPKHRETLQKFDQKHPVTENIRTTQQNKTNGRHARRPIKVPLNVTNPRRSPQKISTPSDRMIVNGVLFKSNDLPSEPTVTSLPIMIRSSSISLEGTSATPSLRIQHHLGSSPREVILNDMIFELFRRLHIDSFVMKTGDFSVKASANPKHTQFIPIETFDHIQQDTAPFMITSTPIVRTQRRLHQFEDDDVKVIVSGSQRKGSFQEDNARAIIGHAPPVRYQGHPRPSLASVRRVHSQRQAGRNPVFHRMPSGNNQQELLNRQSPPVAGFGNWKEGEKIENEVQQNELDQKMAQMKVGIRDGHSQRNRRIASTVRNYRTAQKRLEAIKY